ncbi:unnamed protein product [Auanema sp. JU1783]|nr:unnamed protein product [Auanema sp. JU1783]
MLVVRRVGARCFSQAAVLRPREDFTPVIGLEVHVQLKTKTKLFSRAPIGEDGGPNSRVAPFDMAEPGTLPLLNKAAVFHALRLGLLMNCEIPARCRFDRKHYFYADMPAGYQITQMQYPIAKNGKFGFHVYDDGLDPYWKEVDIIQLQLEQDSGKTIHEGNISLIDLNRAGAPLVEVVTAPTICSSIEAVCFIQQLRLLLMHFEICEGELHKGHIRVDANISLFNDGKNGVRCEVKNMNSIRHLQSAIDYEINRQYHILSKGGIVEYETRACDSHGRTVSMREKEGDVDYRFMAEPNIPTVHISREHIQKCKFDSYDKPSYQKFIDQGFDPRSAIHFAENPLLSNFASNCSPFLEVQPEVFLHWLKQLKILMQRSKAVYPPQSKFFASQFMKVIELLQSNRITQLRAIELIKAYANEVEMRETLEVQFVTWLVPLHPSLHQGQELCISSVLARYGKVWKLLEESMLPGCLTM